MMHRMSDIFTAIPVWTPTVAVFATGAWVLMKTIKEERWRRETDIPAMDGTLSVGVTRLDAEKSIVAINATWRNRGTVPIRMMTRETRIEIFAVTPDVAYGALTPTTNLGEPVAVHTPYADQESFLFEPRTRSELQCHVVLKNGSVYLVRWNLLLDIDHPQVHPWHNIREITCDLRVGAV